MGIRIGSCQLAEERAVCLSLSLHRHRLLEGSHTWPLTWGDI
ncbi:uncharacterized protein G2W53_031345 [Senna tora]|uniref:Uncharacterized protein n=1 Tax=Senna tora TaxID=362788 RepID=A0A834T928_9FABA|nr:uncharacterized protein G2W53_031345 [Senna tora]